MAPDEPEDTQVENPTESWGSAERGELDHVAPKDWFSLAQAHIAISWGTTPLG